ncbi:hypothetical protein ACLOJK_030839 [Asimina triloba]
MEFLKARFKKCQKLNEERGPESKEALPVPVEESKNGNEDGLPKANSADSAGETEDDDDDDFITNEVKRRLKELRNKSFMMLIPEESCPEDEEEEEEETSSSEWRESEAEDKHPWFGFDSFYEKYCERMLFFDKMSARRLQEAVPGIPLNPSPRSASKKLALSLRSLSFKKQNDILEESEQLHQLQDDPYQDLETTYVAQICLSWEALHIQYMQLNQMISPEQENINSQAENVTSYSFAAEQFQQFQVLLQRFIENEPFEQGHRVEIFARIRNSLPKLLQVPDFQGSDQRGQEDNSESPVFASDLRKEIENAIMTFRLFLKSDKKKSGSVLNLFGGNNQAENSLQQIQASLDKQQRHRSHFLLSMEPRALHRVGEPKNDPEVAYSIVACLFKEMRLKELRRKKKGGKKNSWPTTPEQVELLFGLVDLKVVARVLRMTKISKEQLLWCEEKMSKIDVSESRLQRDGFPEMADNP